MRTRLAVCMCGLLLSAGMPARTVRAAPTGDSPATGPAAAATLRAEGLEHAYNLDHADALAAFKGAIAADPGDPAAYRLAAASIWATVLFEQGAITIDDYLGQANARVQRPAPRAALSAAFHDYIRQALTLSEQRLRERPRDTSARYEVGAAYGCLASYTATVEGRVLDSLGPARRAYKEHDRLLAIDSRHKDAGLIVGVSRHAVSGLSPPLRLAARLLGFGGDGDRGLRLVEEAARYQGDAQRNALFTLVLLYNREGRYDEALRVIQELQRRYPRNRLLWLEAGNTSMRAGRPAEARAVLEEGLTRLSQDGRPRAPGEESRWRYAYGASLVALKEIAPAERELRTALGGATHDWVRGRIRKELGKLADLSGDPLRALDEYRQAERLCRQQHDNDCSADAKRLIKNEYL